MKFVSQTVPPAGDSGPAYWFICQGDKLLVRPEADGTVAIPLAADPSELGLAVARRHYLGYFGATGPSSEAASESRHGPANGGYTGTREVSRASGVSCSQVCRPVIHCYAAEIGADAPVPEGMTAEGLRALYPRLDEGLMGVAGRAVQVVAWDRTHRFCGQCGAAVEEMTHERAKRCPRCGLVSYPQISPAIIIAVVRQTEAGKRILLARNQRFPPGRFSVLAGYVEPGETLEDCAAREVCEEVGIRIKNVRYFGSQPWPFPNSLMVGFTAEYEAGEITLQQSELAEAAWFSPDALPNLPPPFTIARQLIEWFVGQART